MPLLLAGPIAIAAACDADDALSTVSTRVPTPLPSPVIPVIERVSEPPTREPPMQAPEPDVVGTWSVIEGPSDLGLGHIAIHLVDGRVLVAGGAGPEGALHSAEIYEPVDDSWTSTGSLVEPRSRAVAVILSDGRVLVTGGFSDETLSTAEIFDPESGKWFATPDLPVPRLAHTAAPLADGGVLVVGGLSRGQGGIPNLETAIIFDPETEFWIRAASTENGRREHTMTVLPNGEVLVAGGQGPMPWAEVYSPLNDEWRSVATMVADAGRLHRYGRAIPR